MSTDHHLTRPHEQSMPGLGAIATFFRWCESLAVILSGPLLIVGLGIALVDLLTDGALLTSVPWLLYAWAIAQAVAVDGQLVGSSYQVRHAARSGRYGAMIGYGVLVLVLAYVGFVAALIFATQQSEGVTTAQALAQLGMDRTAWIWQRSGISIILVVLSGFLRYVAPAKQRASLADERADLERELELEPLRQQLWQRKAVGAAALAPALLAGMRGRSPSVATPPRPPTGPGRPTEAALSAPGDHPTGEHPTQAMTGILRLTPYGPRRSGKRKPTRRAAVASFEQQARAAWASGATSIAKMQAATGMGHSAAQSWTRTLKAEAAAGTTQQHNQRDQQEAI